MDYSVLLTLVLPTLLSFAASWYVFIPVLHMAKLKQMVDNPDARKLQKTPVPVMGGMAVFFGLTCGSLLVTSFIDTSAIVPVMSAMSIMLFVGIIDDMLGVTPKNRFIIEILSVLGMIYGAGRCIDSVHGLFGFEAFSWYIAVPFTVFACVGIINGINMIDGVNGLSSGLCATCCTLFAILFIQGNDYSNAVLNLMLAAALIPFWVHNVFGKKSRMFIGDAGTMVMGALMSWDVIQMLSEDTSTQWMNDINQGISHVAVVVSILAVPVFDTLRVMTMRIINGHSPFDADRTHLHHIIYDYSRSHSITAFGEILLTLLLFLIGVGSFSLGLSVTWQFIIIVLFSILFVWGLYFLLSVNFRLNTGFAYHTRKALASMRQGETSWWKTFQKWVDRGA